MPKRLNITIACLRLSAVLYVLIAIFFFFAAATSTRHIGTEWVFICILMVNMAVGLEVVVQGLKKLKFWAWVVSLIICGIYLPSLFVILGSLGLWGLLDSESRAAFLRSSGNSS